MSAADQRARFATVTAVARVFALVVLAPPVALSGDYSAILNVVLIAGVWMGATVIDGVKKVPVMPAVVVETSLIAFLVGLSLFESTVLVPALVIPLFVGGLVRGYRGALEGLGAELAILAAVVFPSSDLVLDKSLATILFTWLMFGLGFGLIGAVVHSARSDQPDTFTSYRDARNLITQLLDLSGELVDGLDPISIAQNVIDLSRAHVPINGLMVHANSDSGPTPLLGTSVPSEDPARSRVVETVLATGQIYVQGRWVAFPLNTEAGTVAVVSGVHTFASRGEKELQTALASVSKSLRAEALQLDTALLFSRVRHDATAEERRRLSRDLHDGVAQDLASLGYLMDELTDTAESDEQASKCRALRSQLTEVVADLRRSVFSLRNEATRHASLGESIRALAGHIENRAGIPVEVEIDEGPERLRPDVEAELLRIAQEGMNNAVKHARASRITVTCSVHAPKAIVRVSDNGRGLQTGRDDSHGVRIMRERAKRIGAILDLRDSPGRQGVVLEVMLGGSSRHQLPINKLEGTMTR